jgi:hypothetical protein
MASYPISYKPHATGTRIDVPSAGGLAPIGLLEWKNCGQPERRARRKSRVISLRRLEFFQPIAMFATARY